MKVFQDLLLPVLAMAGAVAAAPCTQDDYDSGRLLGKLSRRAYDRTMALVNSGKTGSCTADNIHVRREWRYLSGDMRREYVKAIQCLQSTPSRMSATVPGAHSLYDDFVAIHIAQTMNIHLSGSFLTWHRYFTWAYEQELRTCGYNGDFPYWEWGLDVEKGPAASPLFDGSDTSIGSDGAFIEHEGLILTQPFSDSVMPQLPGNGSGCVYKGPFSDMTVHLGPVALTAYGTGETIAVADPLQDNPRCLKRDLNPHIIKHASFNRTTHLIVDNPTVELFQNVLESNPNYVYGEPGIHAAGHYTIGGDPGGDAFTSPGDPAFFFHHCQIDRVFWIWQMQDFENRQDVFGPRSFMNIFPDQGDVTIDDTMDISPLQGEITIKELMSTVGGPFCYVYA